MSVEPGSRVLTFLIADVRGYTSFTQARGDEAAARLAATFAEIAREGVEARGGDVIELRGDEALAVFESAPEALRAAVDLQLVFADEVELHPELPLRVGIGLDAGAAVPVEEGYRGAALNLAARLCSKAGPGEVLASQGLLLRTGSVEGLAFHDHGDFEMKGLADPVRVSRICPVDLDPDALAARFALNGRSSPETTEVPRALDTATPIVGREREIHRLRWAWRRARRSEGAVMLLLGPPGIGKTRLLAELATSAAHDGAPITYATSRDPQDPEVLDRAIDPSSSSLVLLDDLEAWTEPLDVLDALRSRISGTRALLVMAMDDSSLPAELDALVRSADGAVVRPAPLDLDDIREIAGLYIGASADALPASLLESTGGVPRRIHRNVSEWALAEANRRLGVAASRAAAGRSDLRSVESELAGNVVDLQLIRDRARLYETGDGRTAPEIGRVAVQRTRVLRRRGRGSLLRAGATRRRARGEARRRVAARRRGPFGEREVLHRPSRTDPGGPQRRAPGERRVGRGGDAARASTRCASSPGRSRRRWPRERPERRPRDPRRPAGRNPRAPRRGSVRGSLHGLHRRDRTSGIPRCARGDGERS